MSTNNRHTELKSETFSKLAIIAAQQKRQVFKYLNKITEQSVLEQTIEDCSVHFAKNNLCSTFTGFLQQHISQLNNRQKILQKSIESIALHSQNAHYDIKEVLPLIDTHPDIIFLVNSILEMPH